MDGGLSDDVLGAVLSCLGLKPVGAVRLVCKSWRNVYDQLHLDVAPRDWLRGLSGLLRQDPKHGLASINSDLSKC